MLPALVETSCVYFLHAVCYCDLVSLLILRVLKYILSSRAIGDVSLQPYVTCHPEILEKEIGPEDEYLVLASDGLWVRNSIFFSFFSPFFSLSSMIVCCAAIRIYLHVIKMTVNDSTILLCSVGCDAQPRRVPPGPRCCG